MGVLVYSGRIVILTEMEEKPVAPENQESQEPKEGLDPHVDDDYSLPLSASGGFQWIPRQVLTGYSTTITNKVPPAPEPGFTASAWKETGLCALLLLVFALMIVHLPGLGVAASLFMPLILAKLLLRRGLLMAGFATGAALFADAFLMGIPAAVGVFLQYAGMGFVFGLSYRKEKRALPTLLLAALCCFLGQAFSLLLGFLQDGLGLQEFWPALEQSYEELLGFLASSSGMLTGVSLDVFVEYGVSLLQRLYLGMNILSALLTAACCHWLSATALRRQGYLIPRMPAFLSWRIDWRFSWALILGLLFSLLGRILQQQWMEIIGATLSMVFGAVLAVCGLSFLLWLMQGLRFPGILKGMLILLLLLFADISVYILMFLAVLADIKELRSRLLEKRKNRES